LRDAALIDACVEKLVAEQLDSLFTASEDHGLFWNLEGAHPEPQYDIRRRPRRQDMPSMVRENGAVYATTIACWESCKNRLGGRIGVIVMPARQSIDIDTPEDLALCEAILAAGK